MDYFKSNRCRISKKPLIHETKFNKSTAKTGHPTTRAKVSASRGSPSFTVLSTSLSKPPRSVSLPFIEQPTYLILRVHHATDNGDSVVKPGVELVACSVTLDVVECEGFHLALRVDVGNCRDLGTEDDFRVIGEEVKLKRFGFREICY